MQQQEPQGIESLLLGLGTGTGSDKKLAGKYDSPEHVQLRHRFLQEKAEKQSISLVSNCLAFATPFLPFSFLSTFFLLGKLDGMDKGPEALFAEKEGLKAEMARLAAAEALARKRAKEGQSGSDEMAALAAAHRRQADNVLFNGGKSALWAEKRVLPSKKIRGDRKLFVTNGEHKKKNELKKQKMALEAVKEHEVKKQNFSAVSEISAKLELLEKLVTRLFQH